jgi:hypothetical protein
MARWNEYGIEVAIPVAAWPKEWVCDSSFTGIGVLNSTAGMEISLLRILCIVR